MTIPEDSESDSAEFFDPPPLEPYDAVAFLFTTKTVRGARAFAGALGGPGEVWELNGAYYPVRRNSTEAGLLLHRGAVLIPPDDDEMHMEFDRLLTGLQRADQVPPEA